MPQGQYPAILAGSDYTASLLQSMLPYYGWKTGSTSYTSTTLANDPDLQIPDLAANATYEISLLLLYSTAVSGDPGMKTAFYGPSGAAWELAGVATLVAGATVGIVEVSGTSAFDLHLPTANADTGALLEGTLVMGGITGTWGVQFAENTSGDAVSVLAKSRLKLTRIA